MNSEILRVMASDLGLHQFIYEKDVQYKNRILYSALSCWIKASALDHPIMDKRDECFGVSRKHIMIKCTRFLNEILCRNEECRLWFYPDAECESPVYILRTRLIKHRELLNSGFGTDLILANESREYLGAGIECVRGSVISSNCVGSGAALIRYVHDSGTYSNALSQVKSNEWFDSFLKDIWWEPYTTFGDDWQYFNAYKRVRNNHLCWQNEQANSVNSLLLVRRPIQNNMYEYLLVNTKRRRLHRLDPYLQEIGEHRTIMIAIRALAENKLPVVAICYSDHTYLNLRFHLPDRVSYYLETYAWPRNRVSDKLEWDMPLAIWRILKPVLIDLGTEVTEEQHG